MKIIKIAALTLLLSSPLAHAMSDDCSAGNQLLFVGISGLIAYQGIDIFKDKLNETANNIRALNRMPNLEANRGRREEKIKLIRETGLSAIVVGGATCFASLSSLYLVYQCYTQN